MDKENSLNLIIFIVNLMYFLFLQYFAEEGNKLFRSVKEFSNQVPECPMRSDLVAHLEQIPTYCQQLNFTTKSPASGKVATFNKVSS